MNVSRAATAAAWDRCHASDAKGRGPGFGDVDCKPILRALKEGPPGPVSVAVFDYTPDPVTIARDSIRYMRECEGKTM